MPVVPILVLLLCGLLLSRAGRRPWLAWAAVGSAAVVLCWQWRIGRTSGTGTLDGDAFSVFASLAIVASLAIALLETHEASGRRLLGAAVSMLMASTRDTLLVLVAYELFLWLQSDLRARSVLPLALGPVLAVVLIAASSGGTDLARLGAVPASAMAGVGVALLLVSLLALWIWVGYRTWHAEAEGAFSSRGFWSLALWFGVLSVFSRATAWLESFAPLWAPLVGAAAFLGMVAASLGVLTSRRLPSILFWLTISQAAYGILALLGAHQGRAPTLVLAATGTLGLFLVASGLDRMREREALERLFDLPALRPGVAAYVLISLGGLSLASMPPLPGFIAKAGVLLGIMERAHWGLFASALLSSFLVGLGAMRILSRLDWRARPPRPGPMGILFLAVGIAATLALGLAPESFLLLAARAAGELL